jgi:hypothetical protein
MAKEANEADFHAEEWKVVGTSQTRIGKKRVRRKRAGRFKKIRRSERLSTNRGGSSPLKNVAWL